MGGSQGIRRSLQKSIVRVFQGAIFAGGKGFIKVDFEVYILQQRKRMNNKKTGSTHHGSVEINLTSIHEDAGSILGLGHWVKDLALP